VNKNYNLPIINVLNSLVQKIRRVVNQLGLSVAVYKPLKAVIVSKIYNQKLSIAFANLRV
jgi:hypothetical protein